MHTTQGYLGLVGNGETAALVAPDLSVKWLCVPRFDGIPVFAGALDPERGGRMGLRLNQRELDLKPLQQSYVDDSAVLRTTAVGEGWLIESTDYMPWGGHWLVRELRVTNQSGAERPLSVEAAVRPVDSAAFPVSVDSDPAFTTVQVTGATLLVKIEPGESDPGPVPAGASRDFRVLVAYGETTELALDRFTNAREAQVESELEFWSLWLAEAKDPGTSVSGAWRNHYRRSLVVMKLLSYAKTGALLAAPTASFPAVPGGTDNWDYRYTWLRDGYYTAMTFDAAGLHDEAANFYSFAFGVQGQDGHWRQPLYTVDGLDPAEFIAGDLRGPGGEVPVRFGNAASVQLQLDNEGNILHGLWFHYQTSRDRKALERHWDGVRRACAWVLQNWRRDESGIWELRRYTAHWVHGKAMCYAALSAGARIADVLGYSGKAAEWRAEAEAVRAEVVSRGWNQDRGAYLAHYGDGAPTPHVDISVLALVFYGLLPPKDPRVLATVRLIEQDQSSGGLALYGGFCRYDYAAMPFYLPTLWLARYYLMADRGADCDRLLATCLECATDLGLMAEHFDGRDKQQWGNFPQAFSHEEVARLILERAQGWAFYQSDHQPLSNSC